MALHQPWVMLRCLTADQEYTSMSKRLWGKRSSKQGLHRTLGSLWQPCGMSRSTTYWCYEDGTSIIKLTVIVSRHVVQSWLSVKNAERTHKCSPMRATEVMVYISIRTITIFTSMNNWLRSECFIKSLVLPSTLPAAKLEQGWNCSKTR